MTPQEIKDFILWAKAQGAKIVKLPDAEVEFFATVQSMSIPLPGAKAAASPYTTSEPVVHGEPVLSDPEDPNSAHMPGCTCENCWYLFGRSA